MIRRGTKGLRKQTSLLLPCPLLRNFLSRIPNNLVSNNKLKTIGFVLKTSTSSFQKRTVRNTSFYIKRFKESCIVFSSEYPCFPVKRCLVSSREKTGTESVLRCPLFTVPGLHYDQCGTLGYVWNSLGLRGDTGHSSVS